MPRTTKKLRILVADDHELVRRGIRALLRAQAGWSVIAEAADGREAVESARKLRPDVAVLDIDMPNVSGLEAIRQIREASPDTKVVVLTLHESDQMVRQALQAGALGYILKSDLAGRLVEGLKQVAKGKRFLAPRASEIVLEGFLRAGKQSDQMQRSQPRPSRREVEIIRLLTDGKTNKEVSAALGITVRTVETHRAKIMLKLNVHSLSELIHYALRNGLGPTLIS